MFKQLHHMALCWVSKFSEQKKKKIILKQREEKKTTPTKTQEVVCADKREWVHNCVQKVQQSSHNICAIYTHTTRHKGAAGTL